MKVFKEGDSRDDFLEITLKSKEINDIADHRGAGDVYKSPFDSKKRLNIFLRKQSLQEEMEDEEDDHEKDSP